QLDVSRNTVSAAIDQLAAEGYLDIARGRRPSIAAGLVRLPAVDAVRRQSVAPAKQRLSGWARRISRSNWPPTLFESAPRPFTPGLADARAFPHDVWARCLRRAARNAHPRRQGGHNRLALQEALARHLIEHRGVRTEPRQIIVTPSAQAAIELIARVILDAGDM